MSGEPGAAPPVVLVADDDPEMRQLIVDVLATAGFRALTAADGEEAVALALEHSPDLVVLDVMMPRMDGYTALTRLRGQPATREIPVVILTGQGDPIYRSLSAGVDAVAHLAKPFAPRLLVETAAG
jgi:CheY-like chemotaxis protein